MADLALSIVATPGVRIVAHDGLITTTPSDTAYVVSATSTMSRDQFRMYRMGEECAFAADGSLVRFGDELTIAGRHPTFTVDRRHPEVDVHLDITATDTVTHPLRPAGSDLPVQVLCLPHERYAKSTAALGGLVDRLRRTGGHVVREEQVRAAHRRAGALKPDRLATFVDEAPVPGRPVGWSTTPWFTGGE